MLPTLLPSCVCSYPSPTHMSPLHGAKKRLIICGWGQSMVLSGQEKSSQGLISDLSEHSQYFPGPSSIHRLPVFISIPFSLQFSAPHPFYRPQGTPVSLFPQGGLRIAGDINNEHPDLEEPGVLFSSLCFQLGQSEVRICKGLNGYGCFLSWRQC